MAIYCPRCRAPLPAEARFCGDCGAVISEQARQEPAGQENTDKTAPTLPNISPSPSAPSLAALSVFISYAHTDSAVAASLAAFLQAQGIHVWIDTTGLQPGLRDWQAAIRSAIRQARAVILIATPDSRESTYVRDELTLAETYKLPIFPFWAAGAQWIESIPMGLGSAQYVDARGEAAYQQGVQELAARLRALSGSLQTVAGVEPTFAPRNPYKGLFPFYAKDAKDFFGRGALITALLTALKTTLTAERPGMPGARVQAIVGASGSGKSSILRAGLLPGLKNGAFLGSENWLYVEPFRPGSQPFESLASALFPYIPGGDYGVILRNLMEEHGRGLHWLASALAGRPEQKVVLAIDQFEELFTLTPDEQTRQRFMSLLLTAITEPRGPVIVLLTLRADFYGRLAEHSGLAGLIQTRHHLALPMTTDDLRSAIVGPAAQADVDLRFEEPLVGDLLYEVRGQAGPLPLLQFTLDQLFQRRTGHQLTLAAYRDVGGVLGALTKRAEDTFFGLPSKEHRSLARILFLRLISPGATEQDIARRRATWTELTFPDPARSARMREVADAFVTERLLVTTNTAGTVTIEVSHEALISKWPRLAAWLREARGDLYLQQQISADADEWARYRTEDRLYRGNKLLAAQFWAGRSTPSAQEMDFLQASAAAEQQQQATEKAQQARELSLQRQAGRRQRYVIGLMGLASVLLIAGLIVTSVLGFNLEHKNTQLANANTQLQQEIPPNVTTLADHGTGSLRAAIQEAASGVVVTPITFARNLTGTIRLTSGPVEINKNLTINGPGTDKLTISGEDKSSVFQIDVNAIVTISNLTITNGHNTGYALPGGGGISNNGTLTLANVVISNSTAINGGGIGSTGTLTLDHSIVTGNTATGGGSDAGGGGIYNFGFAVITGQSVISQNTASGIGGGGVENGRILNIDDSTLSGNRATAVSVDGSVGTGGAILNLGTPTPTSSGAVTVMDSVLSGNSASFGGAIFNGGAFTLSYSTVSGNSANAVGPVAGGGGILNLQSFQASDSTIAENQAPDGYGGGINNNDGGQAFFLYCTIYANTAKAGNGSGIANNSTVNSVVMLTASILAGPPPDTDVSSPDTSGAVNLIGANLIDYPLLSFMRGDTSKLITGSPRLASKLADNGGPTETYALLQGSQAINRIAVDTSPTGLCNNLDIPDTLFDQRGFRRPAGNGCDLGAYEFGASPGS